MKKPMHISRGFTLIEMVMVIAIIGIIAGMVAVFIRAPVQGYFDLESRAGLTDAADTALRRMGRDLRLALPNSIRLNGSTTIEFLQTSTGGRYRGEGTGALDFVAGTTTFEVLGGMTPVPTAGYVVVYNLTTEDATAEERAVNAYRGVNIAAISTATANSITLSGAKIFPQPSPGQRFQVVDTPVTYRCADGALTRYWGYGINAAQVDPPTGGSSAMLVQNVSACAFTYVQTNARYGLVTMTLKLTSNNESVTLLHEVHVNNTP